MLPSPENDMCLLLNMDNDSDQELEVDQLAFDTLLEEYNSCLIDEEVNVQTEGVTEVMEKSLQAVPRTCNEKCVCRICLKLTHGTGCWKLFDMTKRSFCLELRKKLEYIAGKINYQVTLHPVVCETCLNLICTTYDFKKQVERVEDRIMEKVNKSNNSIVDLRALLDENANDGYSDVSFTLNNCSNSDQESEEYRERNSNETDELGSERDPGTKGSRNSQDIPNHCIILEEEQLDVPHTSRPSNECENLEQYLASREELLGKWLLKFPPQKRYKKSLNDAENIDKNRCRSNLETKILKVVTECDVHEDNVGVIQIKDDLPNEEVSEVKSIGDTGFVNCVGNDECGQCNSSKVDFSLEQSREIPKKFSYTNQFSNMVNIRRKRNYPRSFDLFDKEHDRYFERYKKGPESKLMMKWRNFAKQAPQYGTGPFLCPQCGIIFQSKQIYKNHLNEHKGKHLVVCIYCGKLVKQQRLKYHVIASHQPPKHECKECDKKFHTSQLLASHIKTMHAPEDEMHQCQICGKLLKKNSITGHVKTHNPTMKNFPCDICGMNFKLRCYWLRHTKRHISTNGVPCSYCGKPFKCKDYLLQHIKQVHEQTDYNCATCGKRLSNRDALRRHLKNVHAPNRTDKRGIRKSPIEQSNKSKGTTSSDINTVNVSKVKIIRQDENEIVYSKISDEEIESFDIIIGKLK